MQNRAPTPWQTMNSFSWLDLIKVVADPGVGKLLGRQNRPERVSRVGWGVYPDNVRYFGHLWGFCAHLVYIFLETLGLSL